jgi:hypothetical protein
MATDMVRPLATFALSRIQAPQFENGSTIAGLMAEHGFSALVSSGSSFRLAAA